LADNTLFFRHGPSLPQMKHKKVFLYPNRLLLLDRKVG